MRNIWKYGNLMRIREMPPWLLLAVTAAKATHVSHAVDWCVNKHCSIIAVYLSRGHETYMAGTVNSVPLFKSGREKRLFSVQLLMTWCRQNASNCTDLQVCILKKFLGVKLLDPQKWGWVSTSPDSSPSTNAHCPTFSELPRPLYLSCSVWEHQYEYQLGWMMFV